MAMSGTFVRLAGNSLTEPSLYLGVYVVQTDERFGNQLSRSIFLLVSGSAVPGWKLLDYVFRTSPKIHLDDAPLYFGEACVRRTGTTTRIWVFRAITVSAATTHRPFRDHR